MLCVMFAKQYTGQEVNSCIGTYRQRQVSPLDGAAAPGAAATHLIVPSQLLLASPATELPQMLRRLAA